MKRRKWDSKTKATIVLEGLKGKLVAAIFQQYQISQEKCYQWHDQFLANAMKAYEVPHQSQLEARSHAEENTRLKRSMGGLTLELKKSEEVWT